MIKAAKAILICALLLGWFTGAQAQVTLTSPANGAKLSSAPAFTWSGPSDDAFLFISVFYYHVGSWSGYYPAKFWLLDSGFAMPPTWWDKLPMDTGKDCYWAVLGANTKTKQWEVSEVRTFQKATSCEPGLISPSPGEVMDNGGWECPDQLIWDFAWSPVEGAHIYHLVVTGEGSPGRTIDAWVTDTSYHYTMSYCIYDTTFHWYVEANFPDGGWCESPEQTFTVEPLDTDCL